MTIWSKSVHCFQGNKQLNMETCEMNTFLPYQDFTETAVCLDRQRLGKQRVEVLQLLRAIHGETKGWRNHPCTLMWEDYVGSLVDYGIAICKEWIRRGYKDTCLPKIICYSTADYRGTKKIPWLTEEFCRSHRSNLLRKDPEYYGQFGWDVPDDLPYIWPTKKEHV